MLQGLKKYLNEEQDPAAIEKVLNKLNGIIMNSEELTYIAVQKKPAVNIAPDCIALTNKRIIFCRPKNLGLSMEFQDYIWKDIANCHIKEGILGAEFTIQTISGETNKIDYLPKVQARKLYATAQEQEEIQREYRRQLDLEEKRAAAGNVTLATNIPASAEQMQAEIKQDTPNQSNPTNPLPNSDMPIPQEMPIQSAPSEDPLASLQKLKLLLENGLITKFEFDAKKAEILARI